jgi:hypothetical protein
VLLGWDWRPCRGLVVLRLVLFALRGWRFLLRNSDRPCHCERRKGSHKLFHAEPRSAELSAQ